MPVRKSLIDDTDYGEHMLDDGFDAHCYLIPYAHHQPQVQTIFPLAVNLESLMALNILVITPGLKIVRKAFVNEYDSFDPHVCSPRPHRYSQRPIDQFPCPHMLS